MEEPLEHPGEIRRLRRCINDLVSVLALPALWSGSEPRQIAHTLSDALLGMLNLDFVYVHLHESAQSTPIEVLRVAPGRMPALALDEVRSELGQRARNRAQRWPSVIRKQIGEGEITIIPLLFGVEGTFGVVAAGAQRSDFPDLAEKLLLDVAANQVLIGLQQARLLSEQKRVAAELDGRVAQRTRELAKANEELRAEIEKRREAEEKLRTDIHDRKRAEDALLASERNLHSIINTIPTAAWSTRPDGYCDFLNQRWLDYSGLSEDQAQGWGWRSAIHPDDVEELVEKWRSSLASGAPPETEARMLRFDGAYRWFLIRANALRDESGNIVKWYGTNIDIEDRKQAEEEVRHSEALLTESQRLSSTGSFLWRISTGEITWSKQLYRTFELDEGAPVTLDRLRTRFHPDDHAVLDEMIEQVGHGVTDIECEHRLLMPDQSVRYLHLIAHASRDQEGALEYIGAVQDVTQRRLAEEALAKARAELAHVTRITSLGVFTASIAHEINQPLSGIVTNSSTCLRMLNADPPNVDGARETARRTIRDGNRASDVVTRLRTLFGRKETTTEAVDLNEAAREVIALSLSEWQSNRVVLRQELADNLPPARGDRVQLQQVILNLLRNASDAMTTIEDRPRELLVTTEREGEDRLRLSVRDAGVGFDLQLTDRLFEGFYTTKIDGMGIGLSVSRSIIEAHQGRLWAALNDGPGSTFAFSIPCAM
jgi:PAS domain S-box-containing protein